MLKSYTSNTRPKQNDPDKPKNILTIGFIKVKYYTKFTIFCILRVVYYLLYKYGFIPLPPKPITISSQSEDYIHLQKTRFLESYTKFSYDDINTNIDKCFYDKKLHAIAVGHPDNELENIWKRRILFETTPRGSIIMHYDAYKHGFVYYSDNSNIPYFVINAVIMKYVIVFRCRDFFMDDQFTLNNIPSPLYSVYNHNESTNTDYNNDNTKPKTKISNAPPIKSNAFAKLKNYNTVSAKLTKAVDKIVSYTDTSIRRTPELGTNTSQCNSGGIGSLSGEQLDEREQEFRRLKEPPKYSRNKIIFSGKICNFNLLQNPHKPCKYIDVSSSLTNDLMQNSSAQSQVFSYRDFKKMRQTISEKPAIPKRDA